ncbi:MAG: alpha/beta hydrolase [Alphaproteobacteria bacterium]|nr:MAG: alpha/beta hydrolase [Alphaproteobacteria bacterium]
MHRRALLAAFPFLAACSPTLGMFDAVAPRDDGVRRVVRDAAFGPGERQKLDVYAPAGHDGQPLPVLMFIYGGSWRYGEKDDYEWLGAALAAQGFLVVVPNYRLVPDVVFPAFVEDCAAAVRWTVDNCAAHGGDPTKLVLSGHSAGGYNAVMLALNGAYLSTAGVDSARVRGAIGLAGPYDFLPFEVDATRNAFGAASDPQLTQPVHFARADAPPLLLLWGEDDTTVGPRNLESLQRVQSAAGAEVQTKTYPGVDHIDILLAISRPFRARAPVLADMTDFVRRVTA